MNESATSSATSGSGLLSIVLPQYDFVAIEGVNAAQFLQGQLTCNVPDASAQRVLGGAYCTIKGRVVSSFLLWQQSPERILLRMRADLVEGTSALLRKYGVFSRVRIDRAQPALCCVGLLGQGLGDALEDIFSAMPADAGQLLQQDGTCLIRRDDAGEIYELWVEQPRLDALLASLARRFSAAPATRWHLALVRGGAAEIQAATREQHLPQMLGYDQSGALSLRKGCYTGQEIVARTHYKGSIKRHLQRLGGTAAQCPPVGSELLARAGGRVVGSIVESAPSGPSSCEVLAVLADDAMAADLLTAAGDPMQVLPIPRAMI